MGATPAAANVSFPSRKESARVHTQLTRSAGLLAAAGVAAVISRLTLASAAAATDLPSTFTVSVSPSRTETRSK